MAEPVLKVYLAIDNKIEEVPYTTLSTAEDVCIFLCRKLGIGTIARHLFALRVRGKQIFLTPSATFTEKVKEYDLRIRFKVASTKKMKKIDIKAYDYYFYQARNDVLENRIPDLVFEKYRKELLGLGITDMYRVMLEKEIVQETVENDYKKYVPKEVLKRHPFFIKKPIHDTLSKIKKSGHDAWYVKAEYLRQLELMVPEYLAEEYKAVTEEEGTISSIIVRVSPFASESGIKYCLESKKDKWHCVCAFEDLGFISLRKDSTVEISRRNGIPFYLKFNNMQNMLSFVSLADGYYRLSVKWTFNICKDVITPSLLKLYSMKCHGPVGGEFSYAKLEEKRGNTPGCFILRESDSKHNIYYIDVCLKDSSKPQTFKLEYLSADEFIFHNDVTRYKTIQQLMNAYSKEDGAIFLGECLPPSENEKSPLLLCQSDNLTGESLIDSSTVENLYVHPRCINSKDLQIYKGSWCYTEDPAVPVDLCNVRDCDKTEECTIFLNGDGRGQKKTSSEGITIVYRGMWRHTKGKKVEVAMKTLKCDFREKYLKDFLDIAGRWVFLQSHAIVKLFGITLSAQMSMISEYVKFGPLDEYLRNNKSTVKEVDLIEASSNLASALWHLEENGIVHGNIRCRKLLVYNHDENNFSVKLSDPGISSGYPPCDVHWIPIECYNNKNYAKHSTPADVWAFGTTLWEIFMFGEVIQKIDHIEAMKVYKSGKRLPKPGLCPQDIYQLMRECWDKDPHRRKQPQAIMRDINQLMYEVYNSRRVHSYAKINVPHNKTSSISSNSLTSQQTGSTFIADELLSMSDSSEIDSDLSVTPNLHDMRRGWPSQEDFSPDDTISEFSNLFQNINISTTATSLDSINSIQSIFELDGEWNVVLQGKIGQGFYGDVYRATLEKIGDEDYEPRQVAVKKLKKAPELSHLQDFEREISIMKSLKHPNIVEILGVLNEPEVSLVMEFVQHGSFQSYLKINKEFLTERQLLKYALDIAMGMAYLGDKKIVHRDLAARNILVVDNNHVKISDFGLAQVVGSNNYYIMKSTRDLPIKWYAPESLEEGKFSTCSDVWSYGVTLWEMFSYGQEPKLAVLDGKKIEGQEQQALLKALQTGARYPCPAMCKQAIYASIIHPCWEYNPHNRPTFTSICDQIQLQTKYD